MRRFCIHFNCFTGAGRSKVSSGRKQDSYLMGHDNATEHKAKTSAIVTCDCLKYERCQLFLVSDTML